MAKRKKPETRVNIVLSELVYRQLKELAEREQRTMKSLLEEQVRTLLKREKR